MEQTFPHDRSASEAFQNIPNGLLDFIRNEPKKEWKSQITNDNAVLTYNLKFSVEKNQEARVKFMVSSHPLFDFQSMNGAFSVAHSENSIRLEAHGKTI